MKIAVEIVCELPRLNAEIDETVRLDSWSSTLHLGGLWSEGEKKQWTGVVCLLLNVVVNGFGVGIRSVKFVKVHFNLLSYVILTHETQR